MGGSARQNAVDFIGIGAGKCGSTWINENIVKHPQISDKNLKELNYFSDLYPEQSFDWYLSQFDWADTTTKKGEFSVTYLQHPLAAERIKKHFPDVKLIAIIRNPVKRTFSNYLHSIRKGDIPPDTNFADYIRSESNLATAHYDTYLKRFFDLFPAEQIKVIILEDFVKDIAAGMREIYEFIGVDPNFLPADYAKRSNEARSYRYLWIENILVRTYRWLSRHGYTKLVKKIVDSGAGTIVRKFNDSGKPLPKMDHESKEFLEVYFREHNENLKVMLGRQNIAW